MRAASHCCSMRTSLVVLAVFALSLVAAPSASATIECQGVPSCTSVAGPWVATQTEIVNAFSGSWGMNCPNGGSVGGTDWTASISQFDMIVSLEQGSGFPIVGTGAAIFIGFSDRGKAQSYQPFVGCSSGGARSAGFGAANGTKRRVVEHGLRPNRFRVVTHRCAPGERLVGSRAGVGFFKKRPPTAQELSEISLSRVHRSGAVRVTVSTGPHVGDDETVHLQVQAICR
jgi:hypothetical protein